MIDKESKYILIPREQLVEIAEELADACNDFNIGKNIRGSRTVSDIFASVKSILAGNYSPEIRYEEK